MADAAEEKTVKLETHDVNLEEEDHGDEPNDYLEFPDNVTQNSMWLVKVPQGLMNKWAAVTEDDVPLAKMRIYDTPHSDGRRKITLTLPDDPQYDIGDEARDWEFNLDNSSVQSQFIFSDRPKPNSAIRRARSTVVKGFVGTQGKIMRSQLSADYKAKLRQRIEEVKPKRHVKVMNEESARLQGRNLRDVQTGGHHGATLAIAQALGSTSITKSKHQTERAARIPLNELLDQIFALFAEKEFWSTKELRQRTEQPVEYIKQALLEHGVAILHKSGPHNNMWELNASYSRSGAAEAIRARTSAEGVASSSKMEEDLGDDDGDDDDDDDDSDEEMEEIA